MGIRITAINQKRITHTGERFLRNKVSNMGVESKRTTKSVV